MKRRPSKTDPSSEEFSLFDNEERIASDSEAMVGMLDQVAERLRLLSKAYRQSLHEQRRLVRLSDRNQLELHNANRRLAEQAQELTRLNSALQEEVARSEALAQELRRQATTDVLTLTATRRHFFELAETAIAAAIRAEEPLGVLLIDLDNFKLLNDRYGHAAGDEVLRTFGELCRDALRRIDIVGRLGGEEFAVVLPKADTNAAEITARRLLRAVEGTEVTLRDGQVLRFGASIGIAEVNAEEHTLAPALARADLALYAAKAAGRGRCVLYTEYLSEQLKPARAAGSGPLRSASLPHGAG